MELSSNICEPFSVAETAALYVEHLGWTLIPVSGKSPIWQGWPDLAPTKSALLARAIEDGLLSLKDL